MKMKKLTPEQRAFAVNHIEAMRAAICAINERAARDHKRRVRLEKFAHALFLTILKSDSLNQ